MKLSIKIEYKDKVYTSNYAEVSEEEKNELNDLIEKAVDGKASHLTFKKDNQNYFFGKKILEESVVSIIHTT